MWQQRPTHPLRHPADGTTAPHLRTTASKLPPEDIFKNCADIIAAPNAFTADVAWQNFQALAKIMADDHVQADATMKQAFDAHHPLLSRVAMGCMITSLFAMKKPPLKRNADAKAAQYATMLQAAIDNHTIHPLMLAGGAADAVEANMRAGNISEKLAQNIVTATAPLLVYRAQPMGQQFKRINAALRKYCDPKTKWPALRAPANT